MAEKIKKNILEDMSRFETYSIESEKSLNGKSFYISSGIKAADGREYYKLNLDNNDVLELKPYVRMEHIYGSVFKEDELFFNTNEDYRPSIEIYLGYNVTYFASEVRDIIFSLLESNKAVNIESTKEEGTVIQDPNKSVVDIKKNILESRNQIIFFEEKYADVEEFRSSYDKLKKFVEGKELDEEKLVGFFIPYEGIAYLKLPVFMMNMISSMSITRKLIQEDLESQNNDKTPNKNIEVKDIPYELRITFSYPVNFYYRFMDQLSNFNLIFPPFPMFRYTFNEPVRILVIYRYGKFKPFEKVLRTGFLHKKKIPSSNFQDMKKSVINSEGSEKTNVNIPDNSPIKDFYSFVYQVEDTKDSISIQSDSESKTFSVDISTSRIESSINEQKNVSEKQKQVKLKTEVFSISPYSNFILPDKRFTKMVLPYACGYAGAIDKFEVKGNDSGVIELSYSSQSLTPFSDSLNIVREDIDNLLSLEKEIPDTLKRTIKNLESHKREYDIQLKSIDEEGSDITNTVEGEPTKIRTIQKTISISNQIENKLKEVEIYGLSENVISEEQEKVVTLKKYKDETLGTFIIRSIYYTLSNDMQSSNRSENLTARKDRFYLEDYTTKYLKLNPTEEVNDIINNGLDLVDLKRDLIAGRPTFSTGHFVYSYISYLENNNLKSLARISDKNFLFYITCFLMRIVDDLFLPDVIITKNSTNSGDSNIENKYSVFGYLEYLNFNRKKHFFNITEPSESKIYTLDYITEFLNTSLVGSDVKYFYNRIYGSSTSIYRPSIGTCPGNTNTTVALIYNSEKPDPSKPPEKIFVDFFDKICIKKKTDDADIFSFEKLTSSLSDFDMFFYFKSRKNVDSSKSLKNLTIKNDLKIHKKPNSFPFSDINVFNDYCTSQVFLSFLGFMFGLTVNNSTTVKEFSLLPISPDESLFKILFKKEDSYFIDPGSCDSDLLNVNFSYMITSIFYFLQRSFDVIVNSDAKYHNDQIFNYFRNFIISYIAKKYHYDIKNKETNILLHLGRYSLNKDPLDNSTSNVLEDTLIMENYFSSPFALYCLNKASGELPIKSNDVNESINLLDKSKSYLDLYKSKYPVGIDFGMMLNLGNIYEINEIPSLERKKNFKGLNLLNSINFDVEDSSNTSSNEKFKTDGQKLRLLMSSFLNNNNLNDLHNNEVKHTDRAENKYDYVKILNIKKHNLNNTKSLISNSSTPNSLESNKYLDLVYFILDNVKDSFMMLLGYDIFNEKTEQSNSRTQLGTFQNRYLDLVICLDNYIKNSDDTNNSDYKEHYFVILTGFYKLSTNLVNYNKVGNKTYSYMYDPVRFHSIKSLKDFKDSSMNVIDDVKENLSQDINNFLQGLPSRIFEETNDFFTCTFIDESSGLDGLLFNLEKLKNKDIKAQIKIFEGSNSKMLGEKLKECIDGILYSCFNRFFFKKEGVNYIPNVFTRQILGDGTSSYGTKSINLKEIKYYVYFFDTAIAFENIPFSETLDYSSNNLENNKSSHEVSKRVLEKSEGKDFESYWKSGGRKDVIRNLKDLTNPVIDFFPEYRDKSVVDVMKSYMKNKQMNIPDSYVRYYMGKTISNDKVLFGTFSKLEKEVSKDLIQFRFITYNLEVVPAIYLEYGVEVVDFNFSFNLGSGGSSGKQAIELSNNFFAQLEVDKEKIEKHWKDSKSSENQNDQSGESKKSGSEILRSVFDMAKSDPIKFIRNFTRLAFRYSSQIPGNNEFLIDSKPGQENIFKLELTLKIPILGLQPGEFIWFDEKPVILGDYKIRNSLPYQVKGPYKVVEVNEELFVDGIVKQTITCIR